MTAADFRAEAVERIARADHQALNRIRPKARDWETVSEEERQEWRDKARRHVDALGDLLPSGADPHPPGGYVSTSCRHAIERPSLHGRCRLECKWCSESCRCSCHEATEGDQK
jgi:hypothetical protein